MRAPCGLQPALLEARLADLACCPALPASLMMWPADLLLRVHTLKHAHADPPPRSHGRVCVCVVCVQIPRVFELVGLGYSAWFTYRYLLFKVRWMDGCVLHICVAWLASATELDPISAATMRR